MVNYLVYLYIALFVVLSGGLAASIFWLLKVQKKHKQLEETKEPHK